LTVFQVELHQFQIPTAMLNSKSLYASLWEVMISFKHYRVFIHDLSNHIVQLIFDVWWAAINVGTKYAIAWNNCSHPPLWRCNVHCGIEVTGCPGSICIRCHQLLRHPWEHGTSSMEKQLLVKAYIAKLNEITGWEVTHLTSSTVDVTSVAILKWQQCQGIPILSSQRKFVFEIYVLCIFTELRNQTLQSGS